MLSRISSARCRFWRHTICAALTHVFQALNPGGTIYIRGQVLDNSHLLPTEIAAASLLFVNAFRKGGAYTEQEYKDWLTKAGHFHHHD